MVVAGVCLCEPVQCQVARVRGSSTRAGLPGNADSLPGYDCTFKLANDDMKAWRHFAE